MKTMKMTKSQKIYDLVAKKPVARFFYQGKHSHPVRRTVLVTNETETAITGYELREGTKVRSAQEAVTSGCVKTYRKDRIARWGDYSRLTRNSRNFWRDPNQSTLDREPIMTVFVQGA
jgi:hypothetical protein